MLPVDHAMDALPHLLSEGDVRLRLHTFSPGGRFGGAACCGMQQLGVRTPKEIAETPRRPARCRAKTAAPPPRRARGRAPWGLARSLYKGFIEASRESAG